MKVLILTFSLLASSCLAGQFITAPGLRGNEATNIVNGILTNVATVGFNTSNTNLPSEGQLTFVDEQGGLVLGVPGGGYVTIGAEGQTRGYNDTGAMLTNGTVVYFDGRQGNDPKIWPASSATACSNVVMGVVTTEAGIDDGQRGQVCIWGLARDIPNPNGYASGDKLFLSSVAGAVTNASPSYPEEAVLIGTVEVATGGTMDIQVRIDCFKSWAQLDEVYAKSSAFGSVYIHDGTNAIDLAVADTYYPIIAWSTNYTGSSATNVGVTATTTGLVVGVTGNYDVEYGVSMVGQNLQTLELGLFVDGVHQARGEFDRKIGTGSDVGSSASGAPLYLTSGSVVNVYVSTKDVTGDFTPTQAILKITRIGGAGILRSEADALYAPISAEETNALQQATLDGLGTAALLDASDVAMVITNAYSVTTPTTPLRTFDPNSPRTRWVPLVPYELSPTASATIAQVPTNYTSSACRVPRATASADRIYYGGYDARGNNVDAYVLHGVFATASANETQGALIRLRPTIIKSNGVAADATGSDYTVCATNGFFSITNIITGTAAETDAISQFVYVQIDTPASGDITNLVPVWILSVNAIVQPTEAERVLGTYLIDGGATEL